MKKSAKKNYIYNLSYQILILLTPFVTTPYISRVLEADGIGEYSFTVSVVTYFTLFASMGISTFAQREVSYRQEDKIGRSQVFWEVIFLRLISTTIFFFIYLVFVLFQEDNTLYIILMINFLTLATDVSWLLQGMEEFGKLVFRNTILKFVNIALIFIFVKEKDDLILYAFFIAILGLLGNVIVFNFASKLICKPDFKSLKPFKHLRGVISLFIPTIAIQIYTVLDKTMIGIFTNSSENGYYSQAMTISKMVLVLVTSLGTVMVPRMGNYFSKNDTVKIKETMQRGYKFAWFASIPLCFGLIGISANFVPWFFGDGYLPVIPILSISSFLIIAIGISNVTGIQYLIPTKRQNIFTKTVIIGAVINLILNLILIPKFAAIGATIASITAEFSIAFIQFYYVRKEISVSQIFKNSIKYFIAGGIMLATLMYLNTILVSSIINTFVLVFIGAIIYFVALLIMKDEFFVENIKMVKNKILKRT